MTGNLYLETIKYICYLRNYWHLNANKRYGKRLISTGDTVAPAPVRDVRSQATRKQGSVNFSDWVFLFELINDWERLSRWPPHIPLCPPRPDSQEFLSMKRNTFFVQHDLD